MNYPDIYLVRFKDDWMKRGLYVAEKCDEDYYTTGSDVPNTKDDFSYIQKIHIEEGSIRDDDKKIDLINCMEVEDARINKIDLSPILGEA